MDTETEKDVPSLRDSLAAAIEETPAVDARASNPTPVEAPEGGSSPVEKPARARSEDGRFAKGERVEAKKDTPPLAKVVAPKASAAPPAAPANEGTPAEPKPEMKAPQSWRAEGKAAWAAVPEAARVDILRREGEIAKTLQQFGEERKFAQVMRQAIGPFEAQIRAEGSTPDRAVASLFETAMALRTAPPSHKAGIVANIIKTYGVPLDGLVAALEPSMAGQVRQQPQQQTQAFDPSSLAKQVEERITQRLMEQRDAKLLERATSEVDSFLDSKATHGLDGQDYSDEIREDMADIIERAAKRRLPMTLEKAYSLAASQHPQVSEVLERKREAEKAAKAKASTQPARAAAVSIRGSPSVAAPPKAQGGSLRDSLEQAISSFE